MIQSDSNAWVPVAGRLGWWTRSPGLVGGTWVERGRKILFGDFSRQGSGGFVRPAGAVVLLNRVSRAVLGFRLRYFGQDQKPRASSKDDKAKRCLERYDAISERPQGSGTLVNHHSGQPISQDSKIGLNFRL